MPAALLAGIVLLPLAAVAAVAYWRARRLLAGAPCRTRRYLVNALGVGLLLPAALLVWNTLELVTRYAPDRCGSWWLGPLRGDMHAGFLRGVADTGGVDLRSGAGDRPVPGGVLRGVLDRQDPHGPPVTLRHDVPSSSSDQWVAPSSILSKEKEGALPLLQVQISQAPVLVQSDYSPTC